MLTQIHTGKRLHRLQSLRKGGFPLFGLFCLLALLLAGRVSGAPTESPDLAPLAQRVGDLIHQAAAVSPVTTEPASDSLLSLFYDTESKVFDLGRRERAQGDSEDGSILALNVALERPSVTADG